MSRCLQDKWGKAGSVSHLSCAHKQPSCVRSLWDNLTHVFTIVHIHSHLHSSLTYNFIYFLFSFYFILIFNNLISNANINNLAVSDHYETTSPIFSPLFIFILICIPLSLTILFNFYYLFILFLFLIIIVCNGNGMVRNIYSGHFCR